MAALSVKNLEQFNKQDSLGKGIVKRKTSVTSRRSSHSVGGSSITGYATGQERWRRLSRGFSVSLMGGSYRNRTGTSDTPKPVKYENTYKMQPDEGCKFPRGQVEAIIKGVLETNLTGARYSPRTCAVFTQRISEELKQRVKDFQLPRYKIVAQVYIGTNLEQSVQIASRALWDANTDNFASYSFTNKTIFAVGTVHAVYFE